MFIDIIVITLNVGYGYAMFGITILYCCDIVLILLFLESCSECVLLIVPGKTKVMSTINM